MSSNQTAPMRTDSTDVIAMIVEIVFGLFGILGMGWLYAGNIPVAIGAFIGYVVLVFIEIAIITVSFGLAACIIVPLNLVITIVSGLRARDYVRSSGASGSIVNVIIGIVLGVVVICGGITLFFGGLGALMEAAQ